MDLVLGIDLGTSYFKLGLFDRAGSLCGLGRVAVRTDSPAPGTCELPVERFWATLRQGLAQALANAGAQPGDVQAVGYASQANSFVLLDSAGRALTPLILWPDTRSQRVDKRIEALWAREDFLATTGLGVPIATEFAVAKLRCIQQNQPALWRRVAGFRTISDYLTQSLTGRAAGDEGAAALLGLWDLPGCDWWDDALAAAGLDRSHMAHLLPPGSVAGPLTHVAEDLLGLPSGIPLAVGSLDHHIAALGAGLSHLADVSESTGTVLACVRSCRELRPRAGCCAGAGMDRATYYLLAFDSNGAAALEWYRREHAPQHTIDQLVALAERVSPGCDGLTAAPSAEQFPALEAFAGIQPQHGHGHFVRAIMESTAASLVRLIDCLCPEGRPERIVATGGGARSGLWLSIKSAATGSKFLAANCDEPACLGAAMLAARAAGWFGSLEVAVEAWSRAR